MSIHLQLTMYYWDKSESWCFQRLIVSEVNNAKHLAALASNIIGGECEKYYSRRGIIILVKTPRSEDCVGLLIWQDQAGLTPAQLRRHVL